LREFVTPGIGAGRHDFAVQDQERQAPVTVTLQRVFHQRVRHECLRILCEVKAGDAHALRHEPVHICSKRGEQRVDARATDPARATHRRIKDIEMRHRSLQCFQIASSSALNRFSADGTMQ
jgi:hypothetical protein